MTAAPYQRTSPTSRAAARSLDAGHVATQMEQCVELARARGAAGITRSELEYFTGLRVNIVTRAVNQAIKAGKLRRTGETRLNPRTGAQGEVVAWVPPKPRQEALL